MRLLGLLVLLAAPASAMTSYGSLSNQSVGLSTSGVIGSVSHGNIAGKTFVAVSSFAATGAAGATIVLSSRTVTIGKTFYVQHIDIVGYLNPISATAAIIGDVFIQSGSQGAYTVQSTMTFVNPTTSAPGVYTHEYSEPVPFASNTTISVNVKANVATATTWISNVWGYEK